MAFPLVTVLTAAPGIISAATDIIRAIKEKQKGPTLSEAERLEKVTDLIEKQALVIEELAVNNRNMALAVRNNRMISFVSISIGLIACGLAIWS
jgi:hypothetical protein